MTGKGIHDILAKMANPNNNNQPSDVQRPVPLGESQIEVAPAPPPRITTFTSLRTRNYRWYWLGQLAAFSGLQMQIVARGWLVYEMTGSAVALGLVSAAFGLPILLFSVFGGAIADRFDKRDLLIVTQAFNGLINLFVAILIAMGAILLWHLVAAAFLVGISFVFNGPARQAIIPELVQRRELLNAISLNSTAMNVTRVVAPAIAGVLLGIIGMAGVYYIVVAFCLLAVAPLCMIPRGRLPAPAWQRSARMRSGSRGHPASFIAAVWADPKEGLRYMRHSPLILSLMAMAFIPLTFGLPYLNLMPVFADDIFHAGATGLGILMAVAGVGALAGSLAIASLGDFRHKGMLLLALALGFGAMLVLFGLSHSFFLSLVILAAVAAGGAGYMAVNNTLIQSIVPQRLMGRVMSIYMITFSLMPLGTLPVGAIGEAIGVNAAVAGGGALVFLFTLAMALLRPSLKRLE